jgi:hypothetical protein
MAQRAARTNARGLCTAAGQCTKRYWIPEPKSMSPVECEGPAPVECALDSAIGQFQLDGSKACGNKSAIVFYAIGDSSREGK